MRRKAFWLIGLITALCESFITAYSPGETQDRGASEKNSKPPRARPYHFPSPPPPPSETTLFLIITVVLDPGSGFRVYRKHKLRISYQKEKAYLFRTRRSQFISFNVFPDPDPQKCTGSSSYLLFLARSVAQQAKEKGAGLLLGGVGAVDGLQLAHHQLQVPARHRT